MNYKEINMQNLVTNIKKLLDDPEVTPEELYELILLTVGENINTHREAMERAKELRDKVMDINSFKTNTSASYDFDTDVSDVKYSHHYFQRDRNK